MSGAAILFDQVRFSYGGEGDERGYSFDFSIAAGAIIAVMGASGSGKSTLLNLVAGFEFPQAGTIRIGERDVTRVPPRHRPVSIVFQDNNLFGHLDVAANVGLGLSPSLRLGDTERARVSEALAATGLAGKEARLPRELSGGERQRVALARALVRDRPVLLLDEPFASLDPDLRRDMVDLVRQLHRCQKMTILLVSHHPEDAASLADELFLLDGGRIAARGPAADPPRPVAGIGPPP